VRFGHKERGQGVRLGKPVIDVAAHVSPHFRWGEFFVSEQHPDLVKDLPYIVMQAHAAALFWLTWTLLEPARVHFGQPFIILSGYRSDELNNRIGGYRDSDHLYGRASDLTVPGIDLADVCQWYVENCRYGFGHLILYRSRNFFHISLPTERYRGVYETR